MTLPFKPPVEPMLAKLTGAVPQGSEWTFEPKWDGFRAMVFRDGDDVYIQSRDLKPLQRYFPELIEPLKANLPERCVLDGEIVIATGGALDFDALLLRIHPAESRVAMLAKQTPASFVAFDILALGDEDLRDKPQKERRARLEAALADAKPPVHLTPATRNRAVAEDWFERFEGAGLDGVVAKADSLVYSPGKRSMIKVKHARTADCVVAGFRWYKGGRGKLLGSMLLGLYDDEGTLHHVGICASFKREVREALVKELAPLRENAREGHPWMEWASPPGDESEEEDEAPQRKPGMTSRWNRGKDLSWEPLRLERVCEVGYDHLQGTRFRHATHFKRWRPDKPVSDCTYAQLEVTPPFEVAKIFGT
ncbi:MAG TPA: ATP-dependent DNA ligase [Polyangiaceae bacterium]|nr:ATP-dependent DNA ligase [Polyangiaceae bacterium]